MAKTAPSRPTIAVIFDFDDTLAPDSTSSFLENLGVDSDQFWSQRVRPRVEQGWDPMAAQFYCLLHEARTADGEPIRITRDGMAEFGRNLDTFDHVDGMFDHLRQRAKNVSSEIAVEYYIVSCGLADIIRHTSVARHFKQIWANELHFADDGRALFPRVILSHAEKLRYLYQIAKGQESVADINSPFATQLRIRDDELCIPLDQMVYIGDGATDMPCFSVIYREDGIAIGISKQRTKEKWGSAASDDSQGRVSNLAGTDYSEGSELLQSLCLAVDSLSSKIALRAKAAGD